MGEGGGVRYYVLHHSRQLVVKLLDDVIELCCVLHDVREVKLTLELREPHGWLYEPEIRGANIDAVVIESRSRRLLRP
jgi:hypothetical protein